MLTIKSDIRNKHIVLFMFFLAFLYICANTPNIVITFFLGLATAYLLKPLAARISSLTGSSYALSAVLVYIIFLTILVNIIVFIAPKFADQIYNFVQKIPVFKESIEEKFLPTFTDHVSPAIYHKVMDKLKNSLSLAAFPTLEARNAASLILHYAISTLDILLMILLFPVLLFFFLLDFPSISNNFRILMNKIGLNVLNKIVVDLDILLSGFIKGLLNIGIILCIYYSIALSLIGFEFALLFGVLFGFAVIVPFVGSSLIITSCILVSILTHGIDTQQFWILWIFAIAQIADNSILTPKIIGDHVGIHPLAIIFSVFVCGGIIGGYALFLAVPIAGLVKIIFERCVIES